MCSAALRALALAVISTYFLRAQTPRNQRVGRRSQKRFAHIMRECHVRVEGRKLELSVPQLEQARGRCLELTPTKCQGLINNFTLAGGQQQNEVVNIKCEVLKLFIFFTKRLRRGQGFTFHLNFGFWPFGQGSSVQNYNSHRTEGGQQSFMPGFRPRVHRAVHPWNIVCF